MALKPFEKQIKSKLDTRELPPSSNAWDRLDAMLTVAEEKAPPKKKKAVWWYAAAAVVMLFAAGMFMKNNTAATTEISNDVVVKESTPSNVDAVANDDAEGVSIDTMVVPAQTTGQESMAAKEKTFSRKPVSNQQSNKNTVNQFVNTEAVAVQQPKTATPQQPDDVQPLDKVSTDAIASSDNDKITVSASSLLDAVDETSRPKADYNPSIFAKVQKKYVNVKTVIANRNKE